MRELTDTIAQISAFGRPSKIEIRVDQFATLIEAIERSGVPLVNHKPESPVEGATFMGVPVVTSTLIPPGFAVILKDEEVVDILDLRAKAQERTP